MFSEVRKRVKKVGQPPGALTYTGKKKSTVTSLTAISYGPENYKEIITDNFTDCLPVIGAQAVTWVNVEGLNNTKLIDEVAQYFKLHPLTVEDILNVGQRPKVEEFEEYVFITLKVLDWRKKSGTFSINQLSIVLGKNFVLSFQEVDTVRFDGIREKLHSSTQRMRELGSDYLVYRLIDSIIDEYFLVLESIGIKIEKVEEEIIASPKPQNARSIYRLKRQMLLLRKAIWPMREAVGHLLHEDADFIVRSTRIYLRDVYDHIMQAIDSLETFRDMLSSMLDMYLTSLTNRMNEIMKTLTIITTIFIPITALASIYGMNFSYMPGLHWAGGFVAVLGLMFIMALAMIFYFRRKQWI